CQFGMSRRAHQAQESAERMADEEHRTAGGRCMKLREIGELLNQVRPVVGDGVGRVVPELLDRVDLETATAQALEHDAVGAGRKAVAVREDDRRQRGHCQISFSSGVEILRSALWRCAGILSGCAVAASSQTGSSMLSNTSRSFCP